VNNRIGRLLRPGMGVYFVVMALFCAAALLAGQYWLAAAESAVTLVVFGSYMVNRNRRDRKIRRTSAPHPTPWNPWEREKVPSRQSW